MACAIIVMFSAYLVYLWVKAGNKINCGCFGDSIWMSPSTSLLKNAVLFAVLAAITRFHLGIKFKWTQITTAITMAAFVILPFILYPIPETKPQWLLKEKYQIDLSQLYDTSLTQANTLKANATTPSPGVPPNLEKGKHILAFLSQSCPHCRIAAYKMHVMMLHHPEFPFLMIIGGTSSKLDEFWEKTKAQNVPYTRLEKNAFMNYTGGEFPTILLISDGSVAAKTDYNTLNEQELITWLDK